MPNWCSGNVEVEGKPKDVLEFCKLFIFTDEKETRTKGYFSRSFIHDNWKAFKKENEIGKAKGVMFNVEFAWSVHSCLIEGYPQDSDGKSPTLIEACKEHNVKVTIESEEYGVGFEEFIECDEKGNLNNVCKDMVTYYCECGQEIFIGSNSDFECNECSNTDLFLKCELCDSKTKKYHTAYTQSKICLKCSQELSDDKTTKTKDKFIKRMEALRKL